MKRNHTMFAVLILGLAVFAGASFAQAPAPAAQGPAAGPPSKPAEAKTEALRNFSDAGDKLVRLAEAVPAEKYTWKPGEGVRSVSEVYLHVAAGCFNLSRRLGAIVPAGIQLSAEFEKQTTDKAKVVELLKQAIEHTKAAYNAVPEADLDKTIQGRTRAVSMRETMFSIASHTHEHLGQSIAYARLNGITPPWTEEAQQQRQPAKRPGS